MPRILTVVMMLITISATQADTQITINDIRGGESKMSSNGKKARIDSQGDSTYSIVNFKSDEFFVVDPQRKEVMNMDMSKMSESADASTPTSQVVIKLNKKGKGPKVAGYKTKEYELTANNQHCGTIFGSKKLLKKKGVSELFDFMNRMRLQSMKMMGAFRGNMDVCEQARQDVTLSFKKTGAPLRMLDAQGNVESEVTKVKTGKDIDSAYYDVPAGYKVVSVADQMNAASQQGQEMMQQMGENMPDMEALMKQMQGQGGEVPEEVMEQLKQMQEMMKQYQQQ